MRRLSGSVGAWENGAINRHNDVVVVQELLETAARRRARPDLDPKGIDGKIARAPRASNTVAAIKAFQKTYMSSPDGLIEPDKTTWRKLIEIADENSGKTPLPPPSPAIGAGLVFPLAFIPRLSYKTGYRFFGARRAGGTREHAGCDLIAPEGTPIYAVDEGTLVRGPYHFYRGTFAIEVKHPHFIARYSEIKNVVPGLRRGSQLGRGQHIANVGKMLVDSMLHFELYQGTATGPLTQRNNPPYQRRGDLLDPTPYLDAWSNNRPRGA